MTDVSSDTVVEALLDEIKELHRRIAYQKAAIEILQAQMQQAQLPPPVP